MHLAKMFIYPIKSCAGIEVSRAKLDRFGLQWDRRWMLVDSQGRFITQRSQPMMSQLRPALKDDHLEVRFTGPGVELEPLRLSLEPDVGDTQEVVVWQDQVPAVAVGEEADRWFSQALGQSCRLVFMSEATHRYVDPDYAREQETVSFADGFPILLTAEASLAQLNGYLSRPIGMERFRPNLVVAGSEAFAEDQWQRIQIGEMGFQVAKPCSRCAVPGIDPETGEKDGEILKVLSQHRRGGDRKVYFGQNLTYSGEGELCVGVPVMLRNQTEGPR